eukprot:s10369_g1.t1
MAEGHPRALANGPLGHWPMPAYWPKASRPHEVKISRGHPTMSSQNMSPTNFVIRSCVYFIVALSISLFIAGFLSGDLSRSSSNTF